MATRRRGGPDLGDLKARLGRTDDSDQTGDSAAPAAGAGEATDETQASGDADSSAASSEAAAQPAASPYTRVEETPDPANTDFASAVYEEPEVNLDEPEENTLSAAELEELSNISGSSSGTVIAVVITAIVALALGFLAASTFSGRAANDARMAQVAAVQERVGQVDDELNGLEERLGGIEVEGFSAEFESALNDVFFSGQNGSLAPEMLSSNSAIMGFSGGISTRLVSLVVKSQELRAAVMEHRAQTAQDGDAMDRESGVAADDERQSAIVFNFDEVTAKYREFAESDAEDREYVPPTVERVSFDALELETRGEGDEERFVYNVEFRDGESRDVDAYNLLRYNAEHFSDGAPATTATDRYVARTRELRAQIQEMSAALTGARTALADISGDSEEEE